MQRTQCFKWALREEEEASMLPIISKARPTTASLFSPRLLGTPQQPFEALQVRSSPQTTKHAADTQLNHLLTLFPRRKAL